MYKNIETACASMSQSFTVQHPKFHSRLANDGKDKARNEPGLDQSDSGSTPAVPKKFSLNLQLVSGFANQIVPLMVADHQTKTNIHFAIVSAECFTNSCPT